MQTVKTVRTVKCNFFKVNGKVCWLLLDGENKKNKLALSLISDKIL